MDLKAQLRELEHMSSHELYIFNLDELIENMLNNIGTIDSELRDKLIYRTFVKLISENYLNKNQLQYVLETCLDNNHLFYKIGEGKNDSVFIRSFSALVIGEVLDKDKVDRFLSSDLLSKVFDLCKSYLHLEQDTRGYVDGMGWAHSIAHGADLLVSAVNHTNYTNQQSRDFLDTIHCCLIKGTVYIDDEDERLINVIESLINKGLDESELEIWILNLFNQIENIYKKEGYSLEFFHKKTNVMNFLKTLYFRLELKEVGQKTKSHIKEYIKMWHVFRK